MEIHVYHHYAGDSPMDRRLARIESLLKALTQEGHTIMQELDTLQSEVESTRNVEESAIKLITGMATQIEALKSDPVKLQALADSLKAESESLAAAVAANTPAAPAPTDTTTSPS